jgi:DNA polymerase-3 subunit delta'
MKLDKVSYNLELVGNSHIVDYLLKSLRKGVKAGSYIFNGPDNLGKTTLAIRFAQALLCQDKESVLACGACPSCQQFLTKPDNAENVLREMELGEAHGDFHLIKKEKDKKNISIEQVREFIRKLNMSSFFNSYKLGVIKHAHALSEEAASALLKTLEEPKEKVIIILVTSQIDSLPATIISRSQILKFNQASAGMIYDYLVKDYKASRSSAKNFSRLSLGRPVLAVKFLEDKDFYLNYMERVKALFSLFNQDVNGRFKAIGELIGGELSGQEAVKLAKRIIEIWLGILRDLLLIEFNQADLIQHEIVGDELMAVKKRLNLKNLLNLSDILRESDKYLEANVNPKLVLENIAVSV